MTLLGALADVDVPGAEPPLAAGVSAETLRSPGIDLRQGTDSSDIYNPL